MQALVLQQELRDASLQVIHVLKFSALFHATSRASSSSTKVCQR